MLCLVRYLQKEMERYCYHVCHLRNVFPKLVCYLPKIMDICYCTKCTVISLTHNFETFFVRHNNRHQRFLPVLYLSLRMSAYHSVVSSLVWLSVYLKGWGLEETVVLCRWRNITRYSWQFEVFALRQSELSVSQSVCLPTCLSFCFTWACVYRYCFA